MEHLLWDSNYAICQESANFFWKGQIVNILDIASYMVSIAIVVWKQHW